MKYDLYFYMEDDDLEGDAFFTFYANYLPSIGEKIFLNRENQNDRHTGKYRVVDRYHDMEGSADPDNEDEDPPIFSIVLENVN